MAPPNPPQDSGASVSPSDQDANHEETKADNGHSSTDHTQLQHQLDAKKSPNLATNDFNLEYTKSYQPGQNQALNKRVETPQDTKDKDGPIFSENVARIIEQAQGKWRLDVEAAAKKAGLKRISKEEEKGLTEQIDKIVNLRL